MVDNPYKYPYVPVGGIIAWDGTGLTGAPDLSTPEKVAAVYGYGTWERYGVDRVTVGAGGDYAAGSVGGEKEHTLAGAEIPNHSHVQKQVMHNGGSAFIVNPNFDGDCSGDELGNGQTAWYTNKAPVNTETFGGNQPHNNMQPYIGTYKYRRIA